MDEQLGQELELLHNRVCTAFADPKRMHILYVLAKGPHYVNEMADALGLPQSTVSRHLKILRERGLVTTSREGTSVYYALADERIIKAMDLLRAVLHDRVMESARLVDYSETMKPT